METISTKEACNLLGISVQAFMRWKRFGLPVKTYGFGVENLYNKEEILKLKETSKEERRILMEKNKKEGESE